MQPGETIKPGNPLPPTPQADPPQDAPAPQPSAPVPSDPEETGFFRPEKTDEDNAPAFPADPSTDEPTPPRKSRSNAAVEWSASEFVAHQKSFLWYLAMMSAAVALAAIIYLLTKDRISAVVVIIATFLFALYGARQPRVLDYKLDTTGLHIGQKLFPYAGFRSYAMMQEGPLLSLFFVPMKRFGPGVTVYYPQEAHEKIIAVLGDHLPHEERQLDPVDRFMTRIRF